VVALASRDPCAEHSDLYFARKEYDTPSRAGAVTITRIDGDIAVYNAADGTTGRLPFVTGAFE
jgi:hypothetical protein